MQIKDKIKKSCFRWPLLLVPGINGCQQNLAVFESGTVFNHRYLKGWGVGAGKIVKKKIVRYNLAKKGVVQRMYAGKQKKFLCQEKKTYTEI